MSRVIFLILITIFMGGCSLKNVGQPIYKYSLHNENSTKVKQNSGKILKISRFKSPINLQSDKIWYQVKSLRIGAYLYSNWNQDFSDMIEQHLSTILFRSGLFKSVFKGYSKAKTNLILEGEVINAMQHVRNNDANVIFDIRLYLVSSKNHKIMGSKDFLYKQKCQSADAQGAIKAYNEIVKVFDKEVILWLNKLAREN